MARCSTAVRLGTLVSLIGVTFCEDWINSGSYRYLFGANTMTWSSALEYCGQKLPGAYLVRPTDENREFLISRSPGKALFADHHFFPASNSWLWSDGTKVADTSGVVWSPGSPFDPFHLRCGLYLSSSAKLFNDDCTYTYRPACQAPIEATTVQPSTTASSEPSTTSDSTDTPSTTTMPTTTAPTTSQPSTTPKPTILTTAEPTTPAGTTAQSTTTEDHTTSAPSSSTSRSEDCASLPGWSSWDLDNNRCYFFSDADDRLSWELALASCAAKGGGDGMLVTLDNFTDFYAAAYLILSAGGDSWTGLRDLGQEKFWIDGSKYNPDLDRFFDDTGTGSYGYLSSSTGNLTLGDDSAPKRYMCFVDLLPGPKPSTTAGPTTTEEPPPDTCGDWDRYDDRCYFFSTEEQPWVASIHSCYEKNADLVSIDDPTQLTYLLATHQERVHWIGLQNKNDIYIWEDGTDATNASSILDPYLDDWEKGKDCVALNQTAFPTALKHRSCFQRYFYICYKNTITTKIEEPLDIYEEFLRLF